MSEGESPARRVSPRLLVGLFAAAFGVLALGYFVVLRTDYVPVFTKLRPGDASAIVTQLDAKDIGYRLADDGTTVLIPEDQADGARLAVAGSDIALKGGVGFELFNKSDMGLTDFAQRINYQRALQGELERSLMMIAEVETARVHLAMPERTIFRAERRNAKAAVEIVTKPGRTLDSARVAGVQQLVAFAVPDLTAGDVVVLDGNGRVLSAAVASDDPALSPGAEEQRSVQGYYRARARAAVQQALPGVEADVAVLVLGDGVPGASEGTARNFRLRVTVATRAPLNAEDAGAVRGAVIAALTLDEAAGDELTFRTGPVVPGMSPPIAAVPTAVPTVVHTPVTTIAEVAPAAGHGWVYGVAGALVLAVGAWLVTKRRRGARLDEAARAAMVARVRAALGTGA